ncbi:MAG: hypothetical protein EOO23_02780 [Comamonadaceae bacterium]|nr:MAG: hypothetical protein EOO23_02780 [Comamonadaceae bacterium]
MTNTEAMREQFDVWARNKGHDMAGTYDTERSRWVWLSPMTADLWGAWLASRSSEDKGVPESFPPSILALLHEVADRKGTPTRGPWEDELGNPLQDDADAAIAWIRATEAGTESSEQWLTISSAPKDGTHILLANKSGTAEGGWLSDLDHGADWEGQIGMAGWWRIPTGEMVAILYDVTMTCGDDW